MKLLLRWKVRKIESALEDLVAAEEIQPKVWSFGAYYINPKLLIFVVGVPTDKEKLSLKDNESQETVDRETNGNWWYHYK